MLDFIGTIVIAAVMVVNINAVVSSLPVSRGRRIAAALAAGLWIGLAAASRIRRPVHRVTAVPLYRAVRRISACRDRRARSHVALLARGAARPADATPGRLER